MGIRDQQENQRARIKLCAVLAERNFRQAQEFDAAGKPFRAKLRRDIASMLSIEAFNESKAMAAGTVLTSPICESAAA